MLGILVLSSLALPNRPVPVEGSLVHPNRLVIRSIDSLAPSSLAQAGARPIQVVPQVDVTIVETTGRSLLSVKSALAKLPGVKSVEFDRASRLAYAPNDPLWPQQDMHRLIKADQAWDLSLGSSDVVVAVIDTGLDVNHRDLIPNLWRNTGETSGNGIDDDGNGYVDDVYGYDFANNDASPDDDWHGHGTLCAGTALARGDNNDFMSGVAPRARVMAVKACNYDGYLFDSYLIPAYVYAADMGADIFSMSYFTDRVSLAERDALAYAVSKGVLPVAAAGNANETLPYYPQGYDFVLAVAATDGSKNRSSFSNYGLYVDVAAPGENVLGLWPGNQAYFASGTSLACPLVSGTAALLKGTVPSATAEQIRAAIEDTANPNDFVNYGFVDARAALAALQAGGSTGREAAVHGMSPVRADRVGNAEGLQRARIQGRGFQAPREVVVTLAGRPLRILERSRDWIDVALPAGSGPLVVTVDGTPLPAIDVPAGPRQTWGAVEASSFGVGFTGGFRDMLSADGVEASCGRSGDGTILVETNFRRVVPRGRYELKIDRRYTGQTVTETIFAYDWSSGSYPYGQWRALATSSVGSAPLSTTVNIAEIRPFLDVERTMYILIQTNGVGGSTSLRLDRLNLVRR